MNDVERKSLLAAVQDLHAKLRGDTDNVVTVGMEIAKIVVLVKSRSTRRRLQVQIPTEHQGWPVEIRRFPF